MPSLAANSIATDSAGDQLEEVIVTGSRIAHKIGEEVSPVQKFKLSEHAQIHGSIRNLANTMAPFNPYTYGGFNYNPAWTQDGAVGRYFNVGGRYEF